MTRDTGESLCFTFDVKSQLPSTSFPFSERKILLSLFHNSPVRINTIDIEAMVAGLLKYSEYNEIVFV